MASTSGTGRRTRQPRAAGDQGNARSVRDRSYWLMRGVVSQGRMTGGCQHTREAKVAGNLLIPAPFPVPAAASGPDVVDQTDHHLLVGAGAQGICSRRRIHHRARSQHRALTEGLARVEAEVRSEALPRPRPPRGIVAGSAQGGLDGAPAFGCLRAASCTSSREMSNRCRAPRQRLTLGSCAGALTVR